ncbi:MAG: DUF6659 family protein [Nitrososphaerales archaeon]
MDYDDLCKEILNSDKKIRFAGVCDKTGKIKHGGQQEGVKSILSPEESEQSLKQALSRWEFRGSFEPKFGKGEYSLTKYEKVKRMTVPVDENHLLLVSTEIDVDHAKIIEIVRNLRKG